MLLAGPSGSSVVSDTTGDDWEADRVALESRDLSFTEFLDRRGLVLRSDLLGAWSGWLTPEFEPRRYRTWFFVASLPAGQVTRDVSSESSSVTWMGALDAASSVDAGQLLMLPPTYLTCLEVGLHSSPEEVLAAAAERGPVEMFMPQVEGSGDSASLRCRSRRACGRWWRRGSRVLAPAGPAASFGSRAVCVLAANASPMTLDGTNTWVLREPDGSRSVVVDPGPPLPAHLSAVRAVAGDVAVVLLTHHHLDHSEAAREFAESVGCGVRALDPAYRLGSEGLGAGDVVAVDGLEVHVVATPGHTADSLSFVLPAERAVLTGDTVLGRGTTVVAHPDGELGAYLASLDRLHALAEAHEIATHLARATARSSPTRCPPSTTTSPTGRSGWSRYATPCATLHAAARDGVPLDHETLPRRIVEIVYADVDQVLWPAAELSVRAQLAYLQPR